MNRRLILRTVAVMGFLAVALGSLGAHKLQPLLLERGTLSYWETAVLYQFAHLPGLALLAIQEKGSRLAYACFVAGTVMFSGSLYVLALVPANGWFYGLVFVTPLGGLFFLAGWVTLWFSVGHMR